MLSPGTDTQESSLNHQVCSNHQQGEIILVRDGILMFLGHNIGSISANVYWISASHHRMLPGSAKE